MEKIKPGDTFPTAEGGSVIVLEYRSAKDILIKHVDDRGHTASVQASTLRRGSIKNPYHRSVFGVGFVGAGEHTVKINKKTSKVYLVWNSMLSRCYNPRCQSAQATYIGCTVVDEWHDFQVFADWFYRQPNSGRGGFELDKDLRVLGNKVYAPAFCSFVPKPVNGLLNDHAARRGIWPQGVFWDKQYFKFSSHLSVHGKRKRLGRFSCPEEAGRAYREAKELYVKSVADQHRVDIHPEVYSNLMSWSLPQ